MAVNRLLDFINKEVQFFFLSSASVTATASDSSGDLAVGQGDVEE